MDNQKTITRQFKDVLSVVFDLCDLDGNGRLSQQELSLHTSLTSNEILPDEEWRFIGETVGFEKDELSKDAFMQLYVLEGRQKNADLEDISNRLNNMGFNQGLKIDHACPYTVTVATEKENFEILLGDIYELRTAEAFIFQLMIKGGVCKQMKGLEAVNFYEYHNQTWSAFGVENKSDGNLEIEINCGKSENCVASVNGREMRSDVRVKAMKNKIGMFLAPSNWNKSWVARCNVAV